MPIRKTEPIKHGAGDRDQGHPHGKETPKSNMAVREALQIAVKRREAKSKGEKERYKIGRAHV